MIRSSLVSGFLTVVALSFVHVPVATADPIVTFAVRRVQGYACTASGCPPTGYDESLATSGPYVAHIDDAATDVDGSAAYTADQVSSISEFLIKATGSSSATVTGVGAQAYAETVLQVHFTLDGNYSYDFSGTLLASMGNVSAVLHQIGYTDLHNEGVTDGLVNFSYSGILGAGDYVVAFQNWDRYAHSGTPSTSGSFEGELSLTPAGVPDGGDTAILFLLGSALLGAFALRERRQT